MGLGNTPVLRPHGCSANWTVVVGRPIPNRDGLIVLAGSTPQQGSEQQEQESLEALNP